jgi:hypothetical protein
MPRAQGKDGKASLAHLKANYHPDAIEYMLKKHDGSVTRAQAEAADQEWASTRAQEFARGQGRVTPQVAEAIMQEPPLNAAIPSKRTPQFEYAEDNVGNEGMAVAESQGEGPAARGFKR